MRGAGGLRAGGGARPSGFPITWTEHEPLATPEAAEAGPAIHRPGLATCCRGPRPEGRTPAAALAASAHVVEGAMTTAFVEHAYIEPEAGAA